MRFISERDAGEIAKLETRLIEFYNAFDSYPAFAQPSEYPPLWGEVFRLAEEIRKERASCRILEIGAGRSGFGDFVKRSGGAESGGIHLTSQDITATNVEYLRGTSDVVLTDNIDGLDGTWDIIFHSYVYEHLCRPREFNETLWDHLSPGGYLVIQCPRYDFPFYFPPCFEHLALGTKLWDALRLCAGDAASSMNSAPRFTIFSDPAVFHLPFRRDRDAVHRVRRSDLRRLFAGRATFTDFKLPAGSRKDWLVKTFFTLRMIVRKTA